MEPFRLFADTGDAVAQLDRLNGETVVASLNLEGRGMIHRCRRAGGEGFAFFPT